MEQRFKSTFEEAQKIAQNRLDEYLKQFKKQDEEKRAALERGDISRDEYRKWRKNKMLRKNQLTSTVENGVRGIQQGICDSTFALNNTVTNGINSVNNAICNLGYTMQGGFNAQNPR